MVNKKDFLVFVLLVSSSFLGAMDKKEKIKYPDKDTKYFLKFDNELILVTRQGLEYSNILSSAIDKDFYRKDAFKKVYDDEKNKFIISMKQVLQGAKWKDNIEVADIKNLALILDGKLDLKKGFAHDFIPLIALIDFLNINPPKKEVLIKKVAMDKEEIDKEFEKYLNTSSVLLKTENIIFKKLKLIKEKDIKEWNKKSSVLRDEKKSPQEIEKVKNKFFNKKKKQYRSFEENIIKKARKTLKEKLKKEGYFVKDKVYRDVEDELWAELIKKFKYRDLVDFFDNKGFLFRFSNEIYSDYGIKFIEKIVLHVKLKDSGEHLFAPGLLKLVVDSNLNFEQAVFIIILFEKDVLQKYKFFQKIVNSDRLQKIYLTLPKKIKKEIEFIFSIVNPFDNLSVFLKIIEDYNQYVKKLYDIEDFNEYITFKSALNFKDPLDLYFDSPDSLLKMWKREFIFNFFEGLRYKDLNKSFFKVRELVKEKDSLVNRLNKIVKKVIKFIENGDIQGVKNFEDKEWDMLSPQNKYGSNNILY